MCSPQKGKCRRTVKVTSMIRILQANLHTSKNAQALISQSIIDYDAQLLIISKPNSISDVPEWIGSTEKKCIMYVTPKIDIFKTGKGHDFVWADIKNFRIYDCYVTPNNNIKKFKIRLDSLEQSIRTSSNQIILAGDFYSHSSAWGSRTTCSRAKHY